MISFISVHQELFLYVLVGTILLFLLWNIRLEVKISRLVSGKDARSLEDTIVEIRKGHQSLHSFRDEVERYLQTVEARLKRSVQGIHTIRFNPFKGIGAGGNQSFSTALLNEDGNGVVISTLYARDRMSFFSKPIVRFSSEYELTEEEREAITKAKESMRT